MGEDSPICEFAPPITPKGIAREHDRGASTSPAATLRSLLWELRHDSSMSKLEADGEDGSCVRRLLEVQRNVPPSLGGADISATSRSGMY